MQSKSMSLIETTASTVIGFLVSLVVTHFVLPLFGHAITFSDNLYITTIFTVVSIIRSYCVRRLFNRVHSWKS
jgi:predicted membrane protein